MNNNIFNEWQKLMKEIIATNFVRVNRLISYWNLESYICSGFCVGKWPSVQSKNFKLNFR